MLKITKETYEGIIAHAKRVYPHECCGVLLGHVESEKRNQEALEKKEERPELEKAFIRSSTIASIATAEISLEIENLNTERAHDRYQMDPKGFIRAEKKASEIGKEIVGIYHSHPDHPSEPSLTDLTHAWPLYSYIIFAIAKGIDIKAESWVLHQEEKFFVYEEVQKVDRI